MSFWAILATSFCCMSLYHSASAQNQGKEKVPTPEEMAAKESERLASLLRLEDWQIFYVDSTLQHDYKALQEEFAQMQKARIDNTAIYQSIRDKWAEQIDRSYKKFFTQEQWQAYLKSGAGKEHKARERRKAKAAGRKK